MVTKELVEHIKHELNRGAKESEIKQSLLTQGGWAVSDINEAFVILSARSAFKWGSVFGFSISLGVAIFSYFSLFVLNIIVPGIVYKLASAPIIPLCIPIIVFISLNSFLLLAFRKTTLKKGIAWGYIFLLIFILFFGFIYIQLNRTIKEVDVITSNQALNSKLSSQAVSTGDPNLCAGIIEGQYLGHAKATCYKNVALKKDDTSICDKIGYGIGGDFINSDDCKDEIYYKRALDGFDISQCLNMFTAQRDLCFSDERLKESIPTNRSVIFSIEPQSGPIGTVVTIKGVGLQYIHSNIVADISLDQEKGGYGGYLKALTPISSDTREVTVKIDSQVCMNYSCTDYLPIVQGKYRIYAKSSNPAHFTVTE